MNNNPLKSNEEIRAHLLRIKGYAAEAKTLINGEAITQTIDSIKREKSLFTSDQYGDKQGFCLEYIDKILRELQNHYCDIKFKEMQQRIKIQILNNRINQAKSKIMA